ncbi:MAG: rane protein [Chloroflexota bacterium]|nr:rane protein [Chloroflexota bacterium]
MSDQRVSNPYATPDSVSGTAASPTALGVKPDARLAQAFLTQAFVWMFVGLIVSAGVAFIVQSNARLVGFAAENFFLLMIAQLALVIAISWGINRISATVALGLFFVYAASLGLTIGLIVAGYTQASVVTAFLSASAMFGAAAIYGHVTKRSLAGLRGILFMGVIGILVASVLNIFLASDGLSWLISIVGVVIFTALTAYDVQRIQNGELAIQTGSMEKAAVIGALTLYLDFVNLFLFMLRLFGGRD